MSDLLLKKEADMSAPLTEMIGGKGCYLITDTSVIAAPTGKCFIAIYFKSDTTFTTLTSHASAPVTGDLTTQAYGTGETLFGKFTAITLASGSCIAYIGGI